MDTRELLVIYLLGMLIFYAWLMFEVWYGQTNGFVFHLLMFFLFASGNLQAMLFLNFSNEDFEDFKSKYQSAAEHYKGQNISFLIGDLDASQGAFQVVPCWYWLILLFLLLLLGYYLTSFALANEFLDSSLDLTRSRCPLSL